jgi:XapX domain-containing protein
MNDVVRAALDGTVAGAGATTLMTGFMKGSQWVGYYRDEIPPEKVTKGILRQAGAGSAVDEEHEQNLLATIGHWGFGMAAGALFGVLHTILRLPIPAPVHGTIFGLLVWLVSYMGWIPAANLIPPPTQQQREKARMPFYAHIVFGLSLGALFRAAERRR